MRVMYIMPRFHTNLVPTVEGWIDNGDEVQVVVYAQTGIKHGSAITPVIAGYSPVFKAFCWVYVNLIKRGQQYAEDIALKLGIPSRKTIKKIIRAFNPDVVILREKNLYSITCTSVCKKLHVKTLLYNQSPLLVNKNATRDDVMHWLVDGLTPNMRITPVYERLDDKEEKVRDKGAVFAPFVMPCVTSPDEKIYFQDGHINLLEIGKYEPRKNHFFMVDAFKRLVNENSDLRLTIVGEKTDRFHEDLFSRLEEYVEEKGLSEYVTLKYNLDKVQIAEEYDRADVFVLPSTDEPASISPIEAMSHSVTVISSTGNGTADYVVDGRTGFVFEDKDPEDLYNKLKELTSSQDKIVEFGNNAYDRIREYCSFKAYHDAVTAAVRKEN